MILRCVFFVFISPVWLYSQQNVKIDSIHKLYDNVQNTDLIKALDYAEQAVQLSEKEKVDSLTIISYKNYVDILYKVRKLDLADEVNHKMMHLAQKESNNSIMSIGYMNAANLSRKKREYDKSLVAIEKALAINERYNLIDTQHKVINSKVLLLQSTKNYKKALATVKDILNNEKFTDTQELARSYGFLAGLHYRHLKQKDSSIYYYKRGIDLVKDTDNEFLKTILYINLGDKLLQTKNREEGIIFLTLAKESAIKSNDFVSIYHVISSIAIDHHNNEEFSQATKYYKEAEEKYGKYASKEAIAHLYWMLSEAYYLNNQPKEAYLTQEKLLYLKDSLFTIEKNKTFEKLQTEYEVEKKNSQIQLLEKEKELEAKQKQLVLGIGGLLLTVLGLLVFVYRNKVRSGKVIREKEQKLFEQEKAQLEQDQKIKRIEGYIEGEEKEKNRIAMELHDGIGGQLSGIKHFISVLPKIKEKEVLMENVGLVSKEVRLLSHSLSTSFSVLQPFNSLLQTLQEQYENHFEIEFMVFPEDEIDKIDNEQKLFLHRTIQEVLNNTYKHANANSVAINVTITDEIVLIIEDNGKGFPINLTPNGIGLQNIQDKLKTLNGTLEIDTAEGKGATVIIKLPK